MPSVSQFYFFRTEALAHQLILPDFKGQKELYSTLANFRHAAESRHLCLNTTPSSSLFNEQQRKYLLHVKLRRSTLSCWQLGH